MRVHSDEKRGGTGTRHLFVDWLDPLARTARRHRPVNHGQRTRRLGLLEERPELHGAANNVTHRSPGLRRRRCRGGHAGKHTRELRRIGLGFHGGALPQSLLLRSRLLSLLLLLSLRCCPCFSGSRLLLGNLDSGRDRSLLLRLSLSSLDLGDASLFFLLFGALSLSLCCRSRSLCDSASLLGFPSLLLLPQMCSLLSLTRGPLLGILRPGLLNGERFDRCL